MGNQGLFEPRDTLYKCPDLSLIPCNNHNNTSSQQVVLGFCKKESDELSHSSSDYYCCDNTVTSNLDSNAEMNRLSKRSEGNDCVLVEKDKPQSSSESYESMVLRNSETSVLDDEYCTVPSSTQSHKENERRTSDKFKRGRRMKDFRKDVLPTLASLSEREIWEDLRLIGLSARANSRINKSCLIVSSRSRNRGHVGRR